MTDEPIPNRHRQKLRPAEPQDLNFEMDTNFLPDDFMIGDVRVRERRHVIFATANMLRLLKKAKSWYADSTFKVVNKPFSQLFSIHAFIRQGDNSKQVPLLFCLMSGRKKRDYQGVLNHIRNLLQETSVKTVIIDFEAAMWKAFPTVFPDVEVRGCCFHWTQSVWRKIQDLGLAVSYKAHKDTYKYLRQLMSLPYLPKEHITPLFDKLREKATSPVLVQLVDYIDATWIRGAIWQPASWSVFN